MNWWNPFSWLPEDPVTRCGWYFISIYENPKDDPYYDFCAYDDMATTSGSWQEQHVSLARYIETGLAQLESIQSKYAPGSFEYELGNFYRGAWPHLVPLFWEGHL